MVVANKVLRIRLARSGLRNSPEYKINVAEAHRKRDGRFIENLGHYSPLPSSHGTKHLTLNFERTKYWLARGAQPTPQVMILLGKVALRVFML